MHTPLVECICAACAQVQGPPADLCSCRKCLKGALVNSDRGEFSNTSLTVDNVREFMMDVWDFIIERQ